MSEDKDLYKKTDGVLFNYKTIKAEISNLDLEVEELKCECDGTRAIGYEERSSPTNAFNSSVENEVLKKEKLINKLLREKRSKERLITKIDNALQTLDETEKEIIRLRCFEKMNWGKIGMIVKMDGDYCGRIKRKVVNEISDLIWISKKYTD